MTPLERILKLRPKMRNWSEGTEFSFAQIKRDGHRVTIFRDKDGQIHAITKKDDIWPKLSQTDIGRDIEEALLKDSMVDGELFIHGKPATNVITALNEKWLHLDYEVFAVTRWNGEDCRDTPWDVALDLISDQGLQTVESWAVSGDESAFKLLEEARTLGHEGHVLKQSHYSGWFKLKPQKTVDCFVVGWKRGLGKYTGTTGALYVAVGDPPSSDVVAPRVTSILDDVIQVDGSFKIIANVSGMNDDQRDEMYEMACNGTLIGRVCEVKYQSVAAKGRLQFPRFVRWREDKPITDCKDDQLC